MEGFTVFTDQSEGSGNIVDVYEVVVLSSCRKLRSFSTDALLNGGVDHAGALLAYAVGVGDLRPDQFHTEFRRHGHAHDVGNHLATAVNITGAGAVSLGVCGGHSLALHDAACADKPTAAQLIRRPQGVHGPLSVLQLKGGIRPGRTGAPLPSEVVEQVALCPREQAGEILHLL